MSPDRGVTYRIISPDLTSNDPRKTLRKSGGLTPDEDPGGGAEYYGTIITLQESSLEPGVIWVGTDDGNIQVTRDNGNTWTKVGTTGLPGLNRSDIWVSRVEPSHHTPGTAYVSLDGHRFALYTPWVFKTTDYGKTWTSITSGLPDGNPIYVVKEDLKNPNLLFAGGELAAFYSLNGGQSWSRLNGNLPTVAVHDLQVQPRENDLVAATHGRGFWILDDIASLRELAASSGPGPRLFAPAVAIRERPAGFTGTPKPKDEPMAADPPFGAYVDYVLKSDAHGPVVIEVRDAAGALVRSYSSADQAPPPDLAHLPIAPEWLPKHEPPSALAGGHRLVWDLRYATPRGLEGDFRIGGVWAPPGRYTVTLLVDGQSFSQPLQVAPDPRVKAGPGSYGEEYRLAHTIEADRVRAHDALAEIEKATKAWAGAKAAPGAVETRARALASPLDVDSLADLEERLGKLQRAVDGADGDPSPDSRAGYAAASRALEAALAIWTALKADIAAAEARPPA
jgi:hypothetical protein